MISAIPLRKPTASRLRSFTLSGAFLVLFSSAAAPAAAQQIIVHRVDTTFEDNTSSDDDPAVGSVAWKGGAIHVVAGDFGVHGAWNGTTYEPATLRIHPSAIVKFAEECTLDGKGVIVTCAGPLGGQGPPYPMFPKSLRPCLAPFSSVS